MRGRYCRETHQKTHIFTTFSDDPDAGLAAHADALWVDDGTLISSENNQAPSLFVDPKGDLYAAFHILGLTAGYNQWHRPMGVAQVGSDGSVWKDVIRPDTVSMVELAPNDGITDLSGYKSVYRGTNAQEAAELLGMTTESYSGQSGKIILVDSEDPPANGNIRIAFEGETIRICASSDKIVDTVRYFMQEYLDDIHFTEADSFEGDLIVNPTNGIDAPDAYVQYVDGWYYGMWTTGKDNLWLYHGRSGDNIGSFRPLCFQRVELDQYGAPALNAKPETYQTETKRNTYTTDVTRRVTKALTGTYVGGNSFTYSADVDVYAANRTAQIMLGYHLDTGDSLIWNERCVLQLTANDASYDT